MVIGKIRTPGLPKTSMSPPKPFMGLPKPSRTLEFRPSQKQIDLEEYLKTRPLPASGSQPQKFKKKFMPILCTICENRDTLEPLSPLLLKIQPIFEVFKLFCESDLENLKEELENNQLFFKKKLEEAVLVFDRIGCVEIVDLLNGIPLLLETFNKEENPDFKELWVADIKDRLITLVGKISNLKKQIDEDPQFAQELCKCLENSVKNSSAIDVGIDRDLIDVEEVGQYLKDLKTSIEYRNFNNLEKRKLNELIGSIHYEDLEKMDLQKLSLEDCKQLSEAKETLKALQQDLQMIANLTPRPEDNCFRAFSKFIKQANQHLDCFEQIALVLQEKGIFENPDASEESILNVQEISMDSEEEFQIQELSPSSSPRFLRRIVNLFKKCIPSKSLT